MAEELQELADRAGYQRDSFGVGHWDMPECKKFAELIIQQCIEIANSQQYPNPISDYAKGFNDGSVFIGLKIIEHFGVKHG